MNRTAETFGVSLDFQHIQDDDELLQAIEDTSRELLALDRAVDRYEMHKDEAA